MNKRFFPAMLLCALAGSTQAAEPPNVRNGNLVDGEARTLYVFDMDAADTSHCSAGCAKAWPPLAAPADAQPSANFTLVQRVDGTRQWAWRGRPLYRYVADVKPGDTTGDGVGGVWHVARAEAVARTPDNRQNSAGGYGY